MLNLVHYGTKQFLFEACRSDDNKEDSSEIYEKFFLLENDNHIWN